MIVEVHANDEFNYEKKILYQRTFGWVEQKIEKTVHATVVV